MLRFSLRALSPSVLLVSTALLGACAESTDTSPEDESDDAAVAPADAAGGEHDADRVDPGDTDAAAELDATGPDAAPALDATLEMDAAPGMDARADTSEAFDAQQDDAADAATPDADASVNCVPFTMPANCSGTDGQALPSELRCTGLYGDFAAHTLACGVEPYAPAYELWSDGATKSRYLSLPAGTTIDVSDAEAFRFPVGTRLWKEFRVKRGEVLQPAETRLLLKSDAGWLYTTYVWSEDGQHALQQNDGVADWLGTGHVIPTRDQCRECHEGRGDFALGFDLLMLGPGASGLTLERLLAQELLSGRAHATIQGHTIPGNAVERAALGYLHANCGVSCHNPSEFAAARDTGLWLRLDEAALGSVQDTAAVKTGVNKLPGIHAKLPPGGPYYDIRPGDPAHSLLLARMNVRGNEVQMPRIGTRRVDDAGVETVRRFIEGMTSEAGYAAPAALENGAPGTPEDAGMDASESDAGSEPDAGQAPDAAPEAGSEPDGGAAQPDAAQPDAGAPSCQTTTPPPTANLAVQVIVRDSALETLTFAAQAPGSDDWYLVEMRGRILRLHQGVLEPTPFLDVSSAINLGEGFDQTTASYDERGLVGLAFAPDYATSGLFYVTLTPSRSNALGLTVNRDMVLEYERPAGGGAPALRRKLIDVPSAAAFLGNIHNANTVRFGPDGKLYVGMGDGGGVNCNDAELNASQNINSVFGKLLRLDLSQPAPYGALDNPFVGVGDARVLHYGLRNPFRFTFDRLTGDLFLGDVGQNRYEELDHAPAGSRGLNFGWATFEGLVSCGQNRPQRADSSVTPPIFVADRTGTGTFSDYRAIVGGVVYRGSALPALAGTYLFGDYYGKRLGALYRCGSQTSAVSVLRKNCDPNFPEPCLKAAAGSGTFGTLTAIVEDHAGELYFVASGNSLLKLVSQ